MLDIKVEGLEQVNAYLRGVGRKLSNAEPLLRRVGEHLRTDFTKNMTAGVDPDGKKLPRPALWTRIAGKGAGASRNFSNPTPLVNTGALRAAMGVVKVNKDSLVFGWSGKQLQKAIAMYYGETGEMAVRTEKIKGKYSGILKSKGKDRHSYIRVLSNSGWITRRVHSGTVTVHPLARKFFFLGKKQIAFILKDADDFLAKAVA